MSSSCVSYLRTLFGQKKGSDCSIVFYCNANEGVTGRKKPGRARKPAKRLKTAETDCAARSAGTKTLPAGCTTVGDPLPAHTVIICGGSERFQAEVDRWMQEPDGSTGTSPELHVSLDRPEDLTHALAAVKYIYTGKVDGDVEALLRVRRVAAYLQVEGAAEACDQALLALISPPSGKQQQTRASTLTGVVQLYGCREFLTSTDMDSDTLSKLLHACQRQLVKLARHSGDAAGAASAGGPSLGELLAWAFRDAPSLMNDPVALQRMVLLPGAAMEALLGCNSFATDNEATVLVMLMHWLAANPVRAEVRRRLLKLIRLSQLNDEYLLQVLPLLPTPIVDRLELSFLQVYALADDAKREMMKQARGVNYDFASAWYCTVPRPSPDWAKSGDRVYEWHVSASELKVSGAVRSGTQRFYGTFTNGSACVVANGFEWVPFIISETEDAAGVFMLSHFPTSLGLEPPDGAALMAQPGVSCCLRVYKWVGDGGNGHRREVAHNFQYAQASFNQVEYGWGVHKALPFKAAPAGRQDDPQLARWAPYLKDGQTLVGSLSWGGAV